MNAKWRTCPARSQMPGNKDGNPGNQKALFGQRFLVSCIENTMNM